ncbi:MAG: YqgE/AlgH family protein [Lautropia sp.]
MANPQSPPPAATDSIDLSNHFLLAMPTMADPNFSGAVVLIAEHNDRGALGLVVNKPTTMTLAGLLERIDLTRHDESQADAPVFYGGPVQTDRGFVLHQPQGQWNSTVAISRDIALTTSKDVLEAVADGSGPPRLLVTLGCAGWGPGQLEAEIGQNAWLTIEADAELLFETPVEERFQQAYRRLGVDPALLPPAAGHA